MSEKVGYPYWNRYGGTFVLPCSPSPGGCTSSVRFAIRSSLAFVDPPYLDQDDVIDACEVVSSSGAFFCQSLTFLPLFLLSMEGGSVCVHCHQLIIVGSILINFQDPNQVF
jgi:hypothetical protein